MSVQENEFLKEQYEIALSRIEREYQYAENMECMYKENLKEYSESKFDKQRNVIWIYTAGLVVLLIMMKQYMNQSNLLLCLVPLCAAISTFVLATALVKHNRQSLAYFKTIYTSIDEIAAYKENINKKKQELKQVNIMFFKSAECGFDCILQMEKNMRPVNDDSKVKAVSLKTYIQQLMKKELNNLFNIALVFWEIFLASAVPGFLTNFNLKIFSSYGFDWLYGCIYEFNSIIAVIGCIIMLWFVRIYRTAHNKTINYNAMLLLLMEGIAIIVVNIFLWIIGAVVSFFINTILPILLIIIVIIVVIAII